MVFARPFIPFLALLLLAALHSPLAAQNCGGVASELHRMNGTTFFDTLGSGVVAVGDINGDGVSDILAGAPYAESGAVHDTGSAFLYSGATGSVLMRFDGTNVSDVFGIAVAATGDVDGDGIPDFLIGADFMDANFRTDSGSAFLYSGATGAEIYRFDGESAGDHFGLSLAGVGDVNGDGIPDLLVGASSASPNNLSDAGAAYLYSGATGVLIRRIDGLAVFDGMGMEVAALKDVDGDLIPDYAVSAPLADPNGISLAGSVYVFSGATGQTLFQVDGVGSGDFFGFSMADVGDANGDGIPDMLAGAYMADPNASTDAGTGTLFSGADGSILRVYPGPEQGMHFGQSLASAGDVDGDGVEDHVFGSPWASQGSLLFVGEVHLYSGATGMLLHVFHNFEDHANFGNSVGGGADFDLDGVPDILIGANGTNLGIEEFVGSIFVESFRPLLHTTAYRLSAASGAQITYSLDFPTSEAGQSYYLLGSRTGSGAWRVPGGCIPLTHDAFTDQMIQSPPALFQGSIGTLNAAGDATVTLTVPAGVLAGMVGQSAWFSAVSMDPIPSLRLASVSVPLTIVL